MERNLEGDERARFARVDTIPVLLEEYRALYSLLIFRLGAMEERAPTTAAILSAVLGSTGSLPPSVKVVVFLGLPLALVWFLGITLGHARSKHDVKLRIDEIERQINQLAGAPLLTFQSHHPSRGKVVAGRSGRGSVLSVYFGVLGLLTASAFLVRSDRGPDIISDLYGLYTVACGLWASTAVARLRHYRAVNQLVLGREGQ